MCACGPKLSAVEITAVDWEFCDGVASVEVVGDTIRFVLYVDDVAPGKETQRRVAKKLVIPTDGVREAMCRVRNALDEAGLETAPAPASTMRH